jgi:hypothetical protein
MTRKAKIGVGCGLALVILLGAFWCFVVLASNGMYGNNAYVNLDQVRYQFLYATVYDFQRAQIVISDTPRQLSPPELSRFISSKDPFVHSADPWGGTIKVAVWRGTNSVGGYPSGGFCRGHIVSCVGHGLWGQDYLASKDF